MIPLVQVILAVWGILVSPGILQKLGLSAPSGAGVVDGAVQALSDHPAAGTTAGGTTNNPAPAQPGTGSSNTSNPGNKAPTVKETANDLVNQPWSMWGLAALCFTAPILISQIRAAGHEAGTGVKTVYETGRGAYDRSENADNYTGNKSRYRKRK